jgi:cell division protein YceG involved in septum cleavage
VAVVVGVLLAIGVPAYGGYLLLVRPQVEVSAGRPVQLEIPKGADTRAIADLLAGAGVVDNAAMFRLRARIQWVDGKLKPGVYDFVTGTSYGSAIDALLAGPSVAYSTVTIPEGFTIQQIAERLEEQAGKGSPPPSSKSVRRPMPRTSRRATRSSQRSPTTRSKAICSPRPTASPKTRASTM